MSDFAVVPLTSALPPLCACTRVDHICVPHAIQLQLRDVRVLRSWRIKTPTHGCSRSS